MYNLSSHIPNKPLVVKPVATSLAPPGSCVGQIPTIMSSKSELRVCVRERARPSLQYVNELSHKNPEADARLYNVFNTLYHNWRLTKQYIVCRQRNCQASRSTASA